MPFGVLVILCDVKIVGRCVILGLRNTVSAKSCRILTMSWRKVLLCLTFKLIGVKHLDYDGMRLLCN